MTMTAFFSSPLEAIAQILGIIALILTIICYQFNSQKKILLTQICCAVLFTVNLALLGKWSGSLLNIHGIARACVFYQRGRHKWAESSFWVWLFCALAAVCVAASALITGEISALDILPFVGTVFSTISLSQTDPKMIRRFMLFSPPCWFFYHLLAGGTPNIGGVLNEIFVLCSLLVAMFRYDFKKQPDGEKKG